ncbi:MAG TPA: aryl-sulfate sulfotransferase [Planctomycetota bacterium]|nr:aryl-sulfate sulfotransferase [Planctomycetota bacterium]
MKPPVLVPFLLSGLCCQSPPAGTPDVVPPAASAPDPAHRVLLQGDGKLAMLDARGEIEWQMPWGGIHDVHQLPDGHLLVQQGAAAVVEIDPAAKAVVWRYDSSKQDGNCVFDALRLPSGNTLVATGKRA